SLHRCSRQRAKVRSECPSRHRWRGRRWHVDGDPRTDPCRRVTARNEPNAAPTNSASVALENSAPPLKKGRACRNTSAEHVSCVLESWGQISPQKRLVFQTWSSLVTEVMGGPRRSGPSPLSMANMLCVSRPHAGRERSP